MAPYTECVLLPNSTGRPIDVQWAATDAKMREQTQTCNTMTGRRSVAASDLHTWVRTT